MKHKKKKLDKASKIAIISTISFVLVGLAAFIIGYGVKDGWQSVLAWFVSRWAIYIYIAIAILVFALIWFVHKRRMEE